ncbi:uncharacterized protein BDW43DRAFT_282086 [Aspergillus alliaceus]|uniref:uncharacterized protein n=1 Tax=Petromyces alliaceus TaxID=209559 RepID=UPI0012A45894|nr:uncharacterized protein BDW43DRAFT_282086 [Aspergillus alliaceus]KAB8231670.1 hypothetical protein BDW43DRAFT_282086 [Aspergillus alliaceus]
MAFSGVRCAMGLLGALGLGRDERHLALQARLPIPVLSQSLLDGNTFPDFLSGRPFHYVSYFPPPALPDSQQPFCSACGCASSPSRDAGAHRLAQQ